MSFHVAIRQLHRARSLHRATVPGALAALLSVLVPAISKAQPAPTVEITPNAIQRLDEPMRIKVTGSPHATLYVLILRSCDSNPATPELRSRGNCKTPVWRTDAALDHKGKWSYSLRWTDMPEQPVDERLWLRVSTDPDGRGPYGQTIFTILGSDSCSLAETFWHLLTGGPCDVGNPVRILPRPSDLRNARTLPGLGHQDFYRDPVEVTSETGEAGASPERSPAPGYTGVDWPIRLVDRPLVLRPRMFELRGDTLHFELSRDAMSNPVSLAPALYYGLDERTTLGIFHDVYACIGGHGCATTYNAVGVEGLYSVVDDTAAMAVRVGATFHPLDPLVGGLHLGLPARVRFGELAVLFEPRIDVEIFERDVKQDVLDLPIQLQYQRTNENALLLTTGLSGPLRGFGGGFAVPVGVGTLMTLSQRVDMGGELLFTNRAGRSGGVDGRLLLRLAVRWGDRW